MKKTKDIHTGKSLCPVSTSRKKMKKTLYTTAAALALLLSACGGLKNASSNGGKAVETDAVTSATTMTSTAQVTPNDQVLSVKELIGIYANPDNMDAAMKKYGYKVQKDYEIFRVAKYDKMYYKNCRLPQKIVDGKYADYPRALRAGISSYVAVGDDAAMMGVFNDNAYENLVQQVLAAGFHLDMEGNDDIYTNGTYYIACNKSYRTLRITTVS